MNHYSLRVSEVIVVIINDLCKKRDIKVWVDYMGIGFDYLSYCERNLNPF